MGLMDVLRNCQHSLEHLCVGDHWTVYTPTRAISPSSLVAQAKEIGFVSSVLLFRLSLDVCSLWSTSNSIYEITNALLKPEKQASHFELSFRAVFLTM